MKGRYRLVGAIAAVAMLATGILSGCGTGSTGISPTKAKSTQVVLAMPVMQGAPRDWQKVQDAINRITQQKIGVTVKVNLIDMGKYPTQFNLMMTGGSKADIVFTSIAQPGLFTSPATDGAFMPLTDLLNRYGQGIKKSLGPVDLRVGQIKGKQYAIPLIGGWASQDGFTMRKDLVKKYNIDLSKVKSAQNMTAIFATIKAHEPTMYPLVATANQTVMDQLIWYDTMGDSLGVLPDWDNNLKLVDLYETPKYAQMTRLIHGWYQKGYINPDAATTPGGVLQKMQAGAGFSFAGGPTPGLAMQEQVIGKPLVSVAMGRPFITTLDVGRNMYSIPSTCKNPKKAMQFLDLLYTDPVIVNLMDYGIAGKDYIKESANVIKEPPGVTPPQQYPMMGVGNSFIAYASPGSPADINQQWEAFDKGAMNSKALGFVFNASAVKTQYAAVENVISQYVPGLEDGSSDPATTLPKFIAQLKAAGIDQIIAAKQQQLDQWAKINNIQ